MCLPIEEDCGLEIVSLEEVVSNYRPTDGALPGVKGAQSSHALSGYIDRPLMSPIQLGG